MPIYAYRCSTCGYAKDQLQKMSDPVLTVCPACGASTYQKQVTAAGFQLKGSGWYVTDFRGDSGRGAAKKEGEAETPAASADAAAAPSGEAAAKPAGDGAAPATPKADKPAAAPAVAPAPPPATPAAGSK